MKILIIEDEHALAESIASYISTMGNICEIAFSYVDAEDKLAINTYDIILLDITLPDGNGLDLISLIRKFNLHCGLIIISAKDSTDDKVAGLDFGADDYLTKPFDLAELNSRIKSLARRRLYDNSNEIVFNEITLLTDSSEAIVNGINLDLTKKQYEILLYLLINKNKVVTLESIAGHVWGDIAADDDKFDFIYSHIKNIRKKIEERKGNNYIHNVYGLGYKFYER
jgi:DNA-binding response OmpR family regulator